MKADYSRPVILYYQIAAKFNSFCSCLFLCLYQPVSVYNPFKITSSFQRRYSPHTLTSYTTDLIDFDYLESQFDVVDVKAISSGFIRSWLAGLKEKGLTSKSVNRKISSLKSFFKYLLKTGEIENSPMNSVISPKISKRLPVFMKEEDTKKLVVALNQSAEDWKSLNAKMLITIFYATGMRLSELINLKEKQIDISRGHIKVLGKGNKERIIPVSNEVIVVIGNISN